MLIILLRCQDENPDQRNAVYHVHEIPKFESLNVKYRYQVAHFVCEAVYFAVHGDPNLTFQSLTKILHWAFKRKAAKGQMFTTVNLDFESVDKCIRGHFVWEQRYLIFSQNWWLSLEAFCKSSSQKAKLKKKKKLNVYAMDWKINMWMNWTEKKTRLYVSAIMVVMVTQPSLMHCNRCALQRCTLLFSTWKKVACCQWKAMQDITIMIISDLYLESRLEERMKD